MSLKDYFFTSESVSEGHPDKICDRVSDEMVDLILSKDAYARVAVETLVTTNRLVLAGEMRTNEPVDHEEMIETARQAVKAIGYEQEGFHWRDMEVECHVHGQSSEIAMGVDASDGKDEGAGDQGLMFGYACKETDALMPAPIQYSHNILHDLAELRHANPHCGLGPDAKSQVTLQYEHGKPVAATSVVVSTQHEPGLGTSQVREIVRPIVEQNLPQGWMCDDSQFYVNPTGRFVIGGPDGDCGLTGRKIIVDTYGGAAPHGGGAFSGKDPTKVDRSAAYMARYLAKNIVASGLAERCTLQIAYAIGVSQPLALYINLHETGQVAEENIIKTIKDNIDLSPRGIRERLQLNRPIYAKTAAYGHFGRQPSDDGHFSWERTDLVDDLHNHLA